MQQDAKSKSRRKKQLDDLQEQQVSSRSSQAEIISSDRIKSSKKREEVGKLHLMRASPFARANGACWLWLATLATCFSGCLWAQLHAGAHGALGRHRATRAEANSIGFRSLPKRQVSADDWQQDQRQQPAGEVGTELRAPSSSVHNITAQNGLSTLLHCHVEPSSDLAVSWFRGTGELQLLTYATETIIPDERFVVIKELVKQDDWALQIKNLDKSTDSGLYQCQTSSDPPLSRYYQLNVVEPQVNIQGAPDMAVRLGANINLTCIISQSPDQQQFIFWYRDERMINYSLGDRGKIVQWKWQEKPDTFVSNLQIFASKLSDSANYTCTPTGARAASIYVHVLEGHDKRLIMFQNDFIDPSQQAASSQQTNSAISVHVSRLSRGRIYALFVGYLIFSSWFQLVAHTQTAISLFLLAVIGFFLDRVTNEASRKSTSAGDNPLPGSGSDVRERRPFEDEGGDPASRALDPLIERANSALELLRTLTSSSSSDLNDVDQDDFPAGDGRRRTRRKRPQPQQQPDDKRQVEPAGRGAPAGQLKPLTSPSGSASSSAASTGYNSDSRSVSARVTVGKASKEWQPDAGEPGMIELVGQPSALRLVMDSFGAPELASQPATPPPKPRRRGGGPSTSTDDDREADEDEQQDERRQQRFSSTRLVGAR